LHDQAALFALAPDAVLARIEVAVDAAIHSRAIAPSRWRHLPAVLVAGEARRIVELLRSGLDRFDARDQRSSFAMSVVDDHCVIGTYVPPVPRSRRRVARRRCCHHRLQDRIRHFSALVVQPAAAGKPARALCHRNGNGSAFNASSRGRIRSVEAG
jgi:hypothetical protein